MKNVINALPAQVANSSTLLTPIFITQNYSMFGHIGGNRNLDNSNLNKIKQSISKKHIKTNAVICILDSILNDITLLNTASKEWDVSDFMNSEAQKGNQNYVLYSEVYNIFDKSFDHESLFFILNNDDNRTGPKISYPSFKSGNLQFDQSDYNYLTQRLKDISKFNHYNELGGKRYYQKALNRLMNTKGFDMGQMLSKIQSRQSTIIKCTTVDGALRQLADIYNYKSQSGRILFIGTGNNIEDIIIR